MTIPGVGPLSALTILSEIGRDMSRFATAGHLVAWAGLCPGQNESAGKRRRGRLRKGAPWLKTMLVQCAWAAKSAKNSYYRAQFLRLRARWRGGEPSGVAGANPARVGVMPISSNRFGPGAALLFLLGAPFLTAFSPKKRCPFQFVPVIALATCERLR